MGYKRIIRCRPVAHVAKIGSNVPSSPTVTLMMPRSLFRRHRASAPPGIWESPLHKPN